MKDAKGTEQLNLKEAVERAGFSCGEKLEKSVPHVSRRK